jgi:hypothetical protein
MIDLKGIDPGVLLAAALDPRGLIRLEAETGVQTIHLAHQVQRLLDDPVAVERWPHEVQALRDQRERRRSARSVW